MLQFHQEWCLQRLLLCFNSNAIKCQQVPAARKGNYLVIDLTKFSFLLQTLGTESLEIMRQSLNYALFIFVLQIWNAV